MEGWNSTIELHPRVLPCERIAVIQYNFTFRRHSHSSWRADAREVFCPERQKHTRSICKPYYCTRSQSELQAFSPKFISYRNLLSVLKNFLIKLLTSPRPFGILTKRLVQSPLFRLRNGSRQHAPRTLEIKQRSLKAPAKRVVTMLRHGGCKNFE